MQDTIIRNVNDVYSDDAYSLEMLFIDIVVVISFASSDTDSEIKAIIYRLSTGNGVGVISEWLVVGNTEDGAFVVGSFVVGIEVVGDLLVVNSVIAELGSFDGFSVGSIVSLCYIDILAFVNKENKDTDNETIHNIGCH